MTHSTMGREEAPSATMEQMCRSIHLSAAKGFHAGEIPHPATYLAEIS